MSHRYAIIIVTTVTEIMFFLNVHKYFIPLFIKLSFFRLAFSILFPGHFHNKRRPATLALQLVFLQLSTDQAYADYYYLVNWHVGPLASLLSE